VAELLDQATRDRYLSIRRDIDAACAHANREPSAVTIVAVTKTFPMDAISKAYALGLCHVGESRVQETIEKFGDGLMIAEHPGLILHLIGHLQSNKVRKAVQLTASIDSVDSVALAETIDRAAESLGRHPRILLEVNTSGEAQKYGLAPEAVAATVEQLLSLRHLTLAGLMTVGPNVSEEAIVRRSFRLLRSVFDEVQRKVQPPHWDVLSMGMSGDFVLAVAEGATEIRLGTALFGQRSVL
jgi:PLP dependent protein